MKDMTIVRIEASCNPVNPLNTSPSFVIHTGVLTESEAFNLTFPELATQGHDHRSSLTPGWSIVTLKQALPGDVRYA